MNWKTSSTLILSNKNSQTSHFNLTLTRLRIFLISQTYSRPQFAHVQMQNRNWILTKQNPFREIPGLMQNVKTRWYCPTGALSIRTAVLHQSIRQLLQSLQTINQLRNNTTTQETYNQPSLPLRNSIHKWISFLNNVCVKCLAMFAFIK